MMKSVMHRSFADAIGVDRKWLQKPGTPYEHFDVCRSKRQLAISAGAVEVSQRQTGQIMRQKRKAQKLAKAQQSKVCPDCGGRLIKSLPKGVLGERCTRCGYASCGGQG